MRVLIETANNIYEILNLPKWEDAADFLESYYTSELFPVIRLGDESLTYIPKHAITVIHIID